jgi:uncharacterized coiled-coil DUF342 family protein
MNEQELKEAARDARRALDRKREEIRERLELMEGFSHTLEATEELLAENESLKDELERRQQEIQSLTAELDEKQQEVDELRGQLLDVREQKVEVEKQHLEAETSQKPMEIHNHFGRGCSAQVFNDKVMGKFVRKEKKRKWKKMVRKML